jgi:hypothetical protein
MVLSSEVSFNGDRNSLAFDKSRNENILYISNENYENARKIVNDPVFLGYINKLSLSDKLTSEEKNTLNDNILPLIREAITLFRKAYKEMPPDAEVNFELVTWLYNDYIRIIKIGKRSEKMQLMSTGFSSNGQQITGYPDMIKFHASECKRNDKSNSYTKAVDEILIRIGDK